MFPLLHHLALAPPEHFARGYSARQLAARRALSALLCLGGAALCGSGTLAARAATFTVQTNGDAPVNAGNPATTSPATLRQAIANAAASPDASDIIQFDSAAFASAQTIALAQGELAIAKSLEIRGPGARLLAISGGGTSRIFSVTAGSVALRGLTIRDGSAGEGGGVQHGGGSLLLSACVLSNNSASNGGGVSTNGALTIDACTLSGNTASSGGAVFSVSPIDRTLPTTIRNSTLSGNTGRDQGGGIYNFNGLTTLDSCTIAGNTAPAGRGGGFAFFGDADTFARLSNTILAGNIGSDADRTPDATTPFESGGFNLVGTGNNLAAFNAAGDRTGITDPQLGALADNGGPTPTRLPAISSPAVDAGNTALTTDQRGFSRPVLASGTAGAGNNSDIGAVEIGVPIVVDLDATSAGRDFANSFTEDGAAAAIANANATISNGGSNLTSAAITLSNRPDSSAESLAATVGNSGLTASYNPTTGVLSISGGASAAVYAQVLRTVTYSNASQNPNAAPRLISVVVSDGQSSSQPATSTITVVPVNDAPTLDAIANLSINEDAAAQSVSLAGIAAGGGESQSLTVTATSSNTSLVPDPTVSYSSPSNAGTLSFAPVPNASGSATITVTVRDNGGTASGGVDTFTRTFTVQVLAVNDLPTAQGQSASTDEDTPLAIQLAATDVETGELRFEVIAQPGRGAVAAVPGGAPGALRYVPGQDFAGTDSFTFQAVDADGGRSNVATVAITVRPVNDAPVAVADSIAASEATPISIPVLANDSDAEGAALFVASVDAAGASGTVAISEDRKSVLFTPANGFTGVTSFSYVVSDGQLTGSARVSVAVGASTIPLTARDDSAQTSAGAAITIPVLANDAAAPGRALRVTAVDASGTRGTVAISADALSVVFSPEVGFGGATSFGYTVSDGVGTATARVAVQVLGGTTAPPPVANAVPMGVDDSYTTRGPLQVLAARGVLANDRDANGDRLVAALQSVPRFGRLRFNTDGSFLYTPVVTYAGRDSFTYVARDGQSESRQVTVTITANAQPDITPPIVVLAGGPLRTLRALQLARGSAVDVYVLREKGIVVTSGLRSVVLQLQRADGFYFNGRTFQRAPFSLSTRRQDRSFWEMAGALPTAAVAPAGRYKWTAIATDNAGNTARAEQSIVISSSPAS